MVDEIQREAFFIYERRAEDGSPGSAETDWVTAEKMVLSRHAEPAAPAP